MTQQVLYTDQTFNVADANEGIAVTVATTFVPAVDGTLDGVQIFGATNVAGTHEGVAWRITADDTGADVSSGPGAGTLLDTVPLTGLLPAEWQLFMFDDPIPVLAGVAYRVGHRTSLGHYAARSGGYSAAGITNGDLSAPQTMTSAGGFAVIANGTFVPSGTAYPARTFNGGLYPIGPVFTAGSPPEDHVSSGTAHAVAGATAAISTTRVSTGIAHAGAAAAATVSPQKPTSGTARAVATASNYSAGGAPGPWLISRRRQPTRIVSRTQVAR